jgi:hypothetical protein
LALAGTVTQDSLPGLTIAAPLLRQVPVAAGLVLPFFCVKFAYGLVESLI